MVKRPRITQMRFAALAREMYNDDDLNGDVLQFAVALAESMTRVETTPPSSWSRDIAERCGEPREWPRWAIRQDLPRHQPLEKGNTCHGQMIRREGLCGKSSTQRHWLREPLTGEMTIVGSCNRHHDQVNALERQMTLAWAHAGKRPGPQNAGGQLERYFSTDWDKVYTWASPSWTRPDSPLEAPRRPRLTLIHGGLEVPSD